MQLFCSAFVLFFVLWKREAKACSIYFHILRVCRLELHTLAYTLYTIRAANVDLSPNGGKCNTNVCIPLSMTNVFGKLLSSSKIEWCLANSSHHNTNELRPSSITRRMQQTHFNLNLRNVKIIIDALGAFTGHSRQQNVKFNFHTRNFTSRLSCRCTNRYGSSTNDSFPSFERIEGIQLFIFQATIIHSSTQQILSNCIRSSALNAMVALKIALTLTRSTHKYKHALTHTSTCRTANNFTPNDPFNHIIIAKNESRFNFLTVFFSFSLSVHALSGSPVNFHHHDHPSCENKSTEVYLQTQIVRYAHKIKPRKDKQKEKLWKSRRPHCKHIVTSVKILHSFSV